MLFVGIDPGQNGGAAVVRCSNNGEQISIGTWAFRNRTERELSNIFTANFIPVDKEQESSIALIEKQGVRPKTDRPKNIATLHDQAGMLRGLLVAHWIPFEFVTPAKWQRHFGLLMPKGTKPTVKKNAHKARAEQLFPFVKVTLANCDALLIAEYARRQFIRQIDDARKRLQPAGAEV